MSDYNHPAENTVYGAFGEFDNSLTDDWTDQDWADYDAEVAAEIAEAEALAQHDAYWTDVEQGRYDDDPNPYHGDYSEM